MTVSVVVGKGHSGARERDRTPMKDLTKLRKISDDLYVEDCEQKDGSKTEFKYERAFEALTFDLFDAQVVFSSEVDLKETQWDSRKLWKFAEGATPEDTRTDELGSAVTITAKCGEFENGDRITVLDHDKPLIIRRASSVTISRLPQWEEVLNRFRSKGGKLWVGRTSINTSTEAQQQGNYSDVDKLHLQLYLPPEQFDYVISAVSTSAPDRLKLSANVKISAFRSEVDKALSEPWHNMDIGIERNTPAILYRLVATSKLTASEPKVSIDRTAKGASEIWLPRLFWLGLTILIVLLMRLWPISLS
jgi:hypothetical protein